MRWRHLSTIRALALIATAAPLALIASPRWVARPLLAAWGIAIAGVLMRLWMRRGGRYVVFVYSNSPNWQPYIDSEILPHLPENAAVLNWSERARWPLWSVPVWAFTLLGGDREFNPLGIVFRRWRLPRVFRFWRPFRDHTHGNSRPSTLARGAPSMVEGQSLEAMRQRFLDEAGPGPAVELCDEGPDGAFLSWTGPRARAVALQIFIELVRRLEDEPAIVRLRLDGDIGDPVDVATIEEFVDEAPALLNRLYCEFTFEFRLNAVDRSYQIGHLDQSLAGIWFTTPIEGEPFWETLGAVLRDFQASSRYVRVSGGPWYEDAAPFR